MSRRIISDVFRDGQFKFNLLMQDDMRRRKFDQIERRESLSDKIMTLADNIDTTIKRRRKEREERQNDRLIKRSQRQSNRSEKK